MPSISLGPVIGRTTSTTSRVLVETTGACTVKCTAVPKKGVSVTATVESPGGRPVVLQFSGLQPGTKYDLSFKGVTNYQDASIRTFAASPASLKCAVVSCNYPDKVLFDQPEPWEVLRKRCVDTDSPIDVLMHIGDQVYADDTEEMANASMPFEMGRAKLMAAKKPTKPIIEEIREMYRALYRKTWTRPATREVLANVSNLMIIDDHEVCDDWGTYPNVALARTPAYEQDKDYQMRCLVARQGVLTYFEYQKQLRVDVSKDDMFYEGPEYHSHRWGDVGVMFLDLRNARAYRRDSKPFLTEPQWQMIRNDLAVGGKLDSVRALLIMSPIPLVFLDHVTLAGFHWAENDMRDHWGYKEHHAEQVEMVRLLDEWKQARPGEREVLVVGGDLHMSGEAEVCWQNILFQERKAFRQIVTSPITNAPPVQWQAEMVNGMSNKSLELTTALSFKGKYIYKPARYGRKRNFALVEVASRPGEAPSIKDDLITI